MGLGNTNFGFSAGGGSTPPPSTTSWMLNGNTVGSEKYFGTNDNFSIPLYTNGKAVGILTKDGDFAIGSTAPLTRITSVSNDYKAILSSIRFGNQASAPSGLVGLRARGTDLSPLPIIQGDEISSFSGIGYHDGGSFGSTGDGNAIFYAAENFKPTNRGTSFKIGTTPIGATTVVYNFGVDSEGNTSMGIASLNPSARLHVKGIDATSSNYALKVDNSSSSPLLYVRNDGSIGISTPSEIVRVAVLAATNGDYEAIKSYSNNGLQYSQFGWGGLEGSYYLKLKSSSSQPILLLPSTNVGITETSPTARLHIKGVDATSSNFALKVDNSASSPLLYVRNDGSIGINESSPVTKLDVNGSMRVYNGGARIGTVGIGEYAFWTNLINEISTNFNNTASHLILQYSEGGNVSIGANTSPARLYIKGIDATTLINQRLEPVTNVTEDTTGNTVNTTDATANVTAQTIAVPTDKVISIESTIVYRKTGGAGVGTTGDGTTIKLNSSVKNVAGTLTLDTVQNTYTGTTNAIVGVSATYTISGTNVLVSVTGVLNDNITWNVITKINTVA